MGGVKADATMATAVPGLLVAGEVVGGANGANRLSGNALTEAFVFGRRAGRSAAERAKPKVRPMLRPQDAAAALDLVRAETKDHASANTAEMIARLQATMSDNVGPIRTGAKLRQALTDIAAIAAEAGEHPLGCAGAFDLERLDWFDLRNMLLVARAVATAALNRSESRGAHQREDFPAMLPHWQRHQSIHRRGGALQLASAPAPTPAATLVS